MSTRLHAKLLRNAKRRAEARKAADIQRARRDPGAFVEYAFRHEKTGQAIVNAPHHRRWHQLLDRHSFAVIMAPVEHGKTQQIGIGRVLWMLGNDPALRIVIVSDTGGQASKLLHAIRTHIEENPRVHEVFPSLRPSSREGDPWHNSAITVERRTIAKEPSIQATGGIGNINGARFDLIVIDDACDFENTRTPDQRQKLIDWVDSTLIQRLTDEGKIWAIGTPWHPEDLLHELASRKLFGFLRFGAVHNPHDAPDEWRPIWPQAWPLKRLLARRATTKEDSFNRKLLCLVRRDTSARFKAVWIEKMKEAGRKRTFLDRAPKGRGGQILQCFCGVDLGVGDKNTDALTSIFTGALTERGRRLIVDIQSGRWTAPEIIDRLSWVKTRYGAKIYVENNAAQKFLVQMAQQRFPVTGLHTGGNKHHETYGVESLALEMRSGWWILPSGDDGQTLHPEAQAWCSELLHYDPNTHTGDRVMASWIMREGMRRFGAPMIQQADLQRR